MCLYGDSAVSINCSVSYYDSLERIVQTKSLNHRGGYDMSYLSCNLSGELLAEERIHHACNGEEPLTERFVYTYDLMGRLLTTSCQLNDSSPFLLADSKYDELGHLQRNKRKGHPSLQTEYSYNVRSWLGKLSGPLFAQKLYYNDGMGIARYNGNISAMTCQYGSESSECGYKFEYDGLNRLTNAFYGEDSALSSNSHRFDEQVTGYDKQGNILGLLRYGRTSLSGYGLIDNLNLTYHGNQLQSVYDNATNSAYGNGMDFKDGASQSQEYVYDAEGTKLRTTHIIGNDTMLTDYCGNLIYENGVAAWLLTESGYITLADDKYHYYLKDHQGNNRVVVDETGNVEEVNDYYPFGGLMSSSSSSNSVQPYKYNGKELDRKGGLDWYDYGARHYDAVIGRWHAVDPSSEKYYGCSPYTYCKNSPVLRIDLDGKDDYVVTKSGRLFNETPKNMRI
jgi:RHS repeat-associated protein